MRVRIAALAGLACLIAAAGAAHADDKSEIAALYKKLDKAMAAKDIQGVMAVGTKDFTYAEAGRKLTAEQMSAQMKQEFAMVQGAPTTKTTILSCKVKGKMATVVTGDYGEMQMAMQDGKPHTFVSNGKSTDTLVKTAVGWRVKSVVVTSNKMTMDGKPFDPSKPPPAPKQ